MVDQGGKVAFDIYGQAILRHGDQEVRLERDPFPLYPGEILVDKVHPLQVVEINTALRLQALRDFKDRYERDEKD
jgi:major vault protein